MQQWSRKWMQRARNLAGSQLGGGFCCYWERIKDRPRLIVAHLNKVKNGHFSLSPEQVEAAYNARNLQELAATEAAIYLLRRGL